MDEIKYCLKEDPRWSPYALNHPAVRQIVKELTDKDIAVLAHGQCYIPATDETRISNYITPAAFREVCIMLQVERSKKWWQKLLKK